MGTFVDAVYTVAVTNRAPEVAYEYKGGFAVRLLPKVEHRCWKQVFWCRPEDLAVLVKQVILLFIQRPPTGNTGKR